MQPLVITDQMGRQISLAAAPQRIVSLVPSQTELLAYLGLEERVVGITKFCIHPEQWYRSKKRVGGTKDVKIEEVLALQPDLIIANKEENEAGVIEILSQFCPVWISDVKTIDHSVAMIQAIGLLTQTQERAGILARQIEASFADLPKYLEGKRVLYLIWYHPWMAAGPDTFIGHLLERLGAVNAAVALEGRYPQLETGWMQQANLDLILLSDEPFPFAEKHVAALHEAGVLAQTLLVKGDAFSWYGSRIAQSRVYFDQIFQALLRV